MARRFPRVKQVHPDDLEQRLADYRSAKNWLDCWPVDEERVDGVVYDDDLTPDGAMFRLYWTRGVTREQIVDQQARLYARRDVVSMVVIDLRPYDVDSESVAG